MMMGSKKLVLIMLVMMVFVTGVCSAQTPDKPVRMAYLQNALDHLGCWVAVEKGFFDKQGVKVEIVEAFKVGTEVMGAFSAGKLDMAYVGEAPVTTAVANKAANVTIVAQANTEGSVLVVAEKEPGITKLSDLEGKTIAIPGHSTVQDFLLKRTLKANQISLDKVKITVIKPPQMIEALQTGKIDAFIAWEPYASQAGVMKAGRILASSKDMWKDHPCCVLAVDTAFLKANPEKVKAVVRAHVQATDFIAQNPDEAVQIAAKYTNMDIEAIRKAMKMTHLTYHLSIEGEKEYVQYLSEMGYIQVNDPAAFTDQLIDNAILKEVLQKN